MDEVVRDDITHGRIKSYKFHGCRCKICRARNAEIARIYYHRIKQQNGGKYVRAKKTKAKEEAQGE